jgi:hypothetical protein
VYAMGRINRAMFKIPIDSSTLDIQRRLEITKTIDIFVDESGDLGFTDKASKYFIIGYVVANCPFRAEVDVKRQLKKLNLRNHHKINEFKFTNDRDFVRHKFLNLIDSLEIEAGTVVIKKTAVVERLRDNKKKLYNFVIAEYIMRNVMAVYGDIDHINLHLDQSMSKRSREEFGRYFTEKVSWKIYASGNSGRQITNNVFHDYSHQQPCLQIADYIAGSSFQLHERSKSQYYEMIKAKVIHTHSWGI